MKGKNGYVWPGEAIESMRNSHALMKFCGKEFKTNIARDYCFARDAAIQMGADVNNFPRSIGDCNYRERRQK